MMSETPRLSVRLSVMSVPTMLNSTTANQYKLGVYFLLRIWTIKQAISAIDMTTLVIVKPKLRLKFM